MSRLRGQGAPTNGPAAGGGGKPPPLDHLGVFFDTLTLSDLQGLVARAIDGGRPTIIANHNLHSVYLHRRDAKMRRFYGRADHVHVDGMALVFSARLAGLPISRDHRVTYVDWIWPLAGEAARRGWRVFHLGGARGVAERAVHELRGRHPALVMETHHGYFDPRPEGSENRRILERIAAFGPDILMVGMGMPRQEHWILDNLAHLAAPVILPCGACLDYVAGATPTPPRWAGRVGLEWLFRLARDPVRLARRYLFEPLFLIGPLSRELVDRRLLGRGGRRGDRGSAR